MKVNEINAKYKNVGNALETAIASANSVVLTGDDENKELSVIKKTLNELNEDFKCEISELEKSTEWERFCIAFFGETNAGKSTIIESLRILYDEETRRSELLEQYKEHRNMLLDNENNYKAVINQLKQLNECLEKEKGRRIKEDIKKILFLFCGAGFGVFISWFFNI